MESRLAKVVEMKNITKIFPGTVANDRVDFDLEKGEIHVLLGENGAGKTTLMNILYGLYQQTSGEIYYHGKKVDIKGPNAAIALGIGMVHQHFMLVENFTVAENIILGNEPSKWKGWKLVEGRSTRRYTSDSVVTQVVTEAGFDPYEKKLLGITAMQKLLGKQRFEELLKAYIEKPPGKPTLVPESDKRPAINNAKFDFMEEKNHE